MLRVNLPRMEVASTSEATHAINFPAVMAIVAGIVADPKRFGVGVDQVSAVEPAGSVRMPVRQSAKVSVDCLAKVAVGYLAVY